MKRLVLRIADYGIKIILLEVVPGCEQELVEQIRSRSKGTPLQNALIFGTLGKYDLMLAYPSEFGPDFQLLGTLPGILSSTEHLCFVWHRQDLDDSNSFVKIHNAPVLGLSFLRLDPLFLRNHGVLVELALMSMLSRNKAYTCMGTLGWAEMCVLTRGNSVKEVYDLIIKLATENGVLGKGPDVRASNLILKSFSIVGFNVNSHCSDAHRNPKTDEFTNGPSPVLQIACDPDYTNRIAEYLNPPDCRFGSLGRHDIQFRPNQGQWSNFFDKVRKLRQNFRRGVFATSIVPIGELAPDDSGRSRYVALTRSPRIELSAKEAERLCKDRQDQLGSALVGLIYAYNSFVQNRLLQHTFLDLRPYLKLMLRKYANGDFDGPGMELAFDNLIQLLWFGMLERLKGAYLSIEDSEPSYPAFRGGMQRVIGALEAVVLSSMELAKEHWRGAIVVGSRGEFKHMDLMLNLPMEAADNPQNWWGLSHEVSHILVQFKDIIRGTSAENDPVLRLALGPHLDPRLPSEEREAKLRALIEVATDIVDFCCFFGGNWKLYRERIMDHYKHYFVRQRIPTELRLSYLRRIVSVFAYHSVYHLKNKPKTALESPREVKSMIDQVLGGERQAFFGENGDTPALKAAERDMVGVFIETAGFFRFLHARLTRAEWFKQLSRLRGKPASKKDLTVLDALKKGEVVWEEIGDPWLLVCRAGANGGGSPQFKHRIALILTLWHRYASHWAARTARW